MPTVPKLNELEIGARGLPGVALIPVEAQTHNISRLPDLNQQARTRGFGNGAHLGTGGVRKAELSDSDAAYQAAKQAGALQQSIGQGISNLGLVIQDIALKERAKADEARIQDAKNQFLRAQLDLEYGDDGWKNRKGGAAMPSGDDHRPIDDEYDERLNSSYQQISQSLGNDRQRELFREWADGERLQQRSKIRAHAMREYDAYREDTYKSRKAIAGELVMHGDIERGIALLQENNARYAAENGLPPEWLETANRQGVSGEITATVGQMIEGGDLAGASALLTQYRGYISGEDMARAAGTLKTAQKIQQATQDAEADIAAMQGTFDPIRRLGDPYAIYNLGYNDSRYRKAAFGKESGGNNNAVNGDTGATGKGQFLATTWISFGKSAVGKALRGNMSESAWLEQRKNPAAMDAAMDWYRDTARAHLQANGVPWNDTTAYLAHFAGAAGAVAIYQADPNGLARDTVRKLKNGGLMIEKNKTVFTEKRTNADMMAWAAKSIGVKPDPNAPPTGRPPRQEWPTDAQLELNVLKYGNKTQQNVYKDLIRATRNVAQEADAKQYTGHLNGALDTVFSGGSIADIKPEDWNALTPEDRNKVITQRESVHALDQRVLTRENLDIFLEASDPKKLAAIDFETLKAMRADLGDQYFKELWTKKQALEKAQVDKERQMTLEDTVWKSMLRELGILNPWKLKDEAEKEQLAYAELNIRQSINYHVTQALNAGETLTQEELRKRVREDVKARVIKYHENWYGKRVGEEVPAILQPPSDGLYEDRNKLGMWRVD